MSATSGLDDSLKAGSMRLRRGPSHGVDDGIDLMAISQSVKRGERKTDLGPQGDHDQLVTPGRFDCLAKLDIFPGVDLRPVDLDVIGEDLGKLGDGSGSGSVG